MKKRLTLIYTLICILSTVFVMPVSASGTVYTFTGNNVAKKCTLEDVTDAPLTDNITVTTAGEPNWKCAGITDLENNKALGYYPINDTFKYDGSYIFLGTGSTNENTSFILNIPKIEKGSKVTISFCKPLITNNGSSRRNSDDPYAYLKIADRFISINGDNFDEWREETVIIGEDTETIEFNCLKWGAVAINKIEIADAKETPLYNLTVNSTQFANIEVNGIKFYADANGKVNLPSFAKGETITVIAQKEGYQTVKQSVTVAEGDIDIHIPLECESDAVFYESDFGNKDGKITLDTFKLDVPTKAITKLFANVTFKEDGEMSIKDEDDEEILKIKYSDYALSANGVEITKKDNMKFEAFFDTESDIITLIENNRFFNISPLTKDIEKISEVTSASSLILDYIGISYPDKAIIDITGPENVSSLENDENWVYYNVKPQYQKSGTEYKFTFNGKAVDAHICPDEIRKKDTDASSTFFPVAIPKGYSGTAILAVEYNGYKATKAINVVPSPKLSEIKHTGRTLNLNETKTFKLDEASDEFGNEIFNVTLKDFKSSDENVIKIDENGFMTAVGKGNATITVNAYTGVDNIISVEYTVDNFVISGSVNGTAYEVNDLIKNNNITSYKVVFADGGEKEIEVSKIPAKTLEKDGMVIVSSYNAAGQLLETTHIEVKKGTKCQISTDSKTVYFISDTECTKITESDCEIEGFKIESDKKTDYSIVPVYTFTGVGDVKEGKTFDAVFGEGLYDITFKKAEKKRGDIFVNGYMVGNNVDQADADRKLVDGALYTAEDIKIKNGELTVSMSDGSTMLDYVTVYQRPHFRSSRVYIIGDSLACAYYGEFSQTVGGGRSGWGQQIGDFLNVPVTNLANSGQYAAGLYKTAFPSVTENGSRGDILLIECGYNDRNYSNREEMTECVKNMISECREVGIIPVIVTPNASNHDYKPSVVWSGYLRDIAVDMNCQLIDLSKLSYDFLYSIYADDTAVIGNTYNLTVTGTDTLHASYAGAYKWAEIVAQGLKDLGYESYVNTDFSYTFTDALGNKIITQIK